MLCLSALAWWSARDAEDALARESANCIQTAFAQSVSQATQRPGSALVAASSLFAASRSVERSEWRIFADRLLHEAGPGITCLGFAVEVAPPSVPAFQTAVRADDARSFTAAPAAAAPFHALIEFAVARADAPTLLGTDLAADAVVRQAIQSSSTDIARTTRWPATSQDAERWVMVREVSGRSAGSAASGLAAPRLWVFAVIAPTTLVAAQVAAISPAISILPASASKSATPSQGEIIAATTLGSTPLVFRATLPPRASRAAHARSLTTLAIGAATSLTASLLTFYVVGRVAWGRAEVQLAAARAARARTESLSLRLFAAHPSAAAVLIDASGRIEAATEPFARLAGYQPEQVIGSNLATLFAGPQTDVFNAALADHLRNRAPLDGEFTLLNPEGEPLHLAIRARTAAEPAGVPPRSVLFVGNITREYHLREQAVEARERLARALQTAGDGLWELNPVVDAARFSPRFAQLLGVPPEALGQSLAAWQARVHPDDRHLFDALRLDAMAARPHECELRLLTGAGEPRWFRVRIAAARTESPSPFTMFGSISDVTERQFAQDQLHRLLDDTSRQATHLTALRQLAAAAAGPASLPELLAVFTNILASAFQHAHACAASVCLAEHEARSPLYRRTPWQLTAGFETARGEGEISVAYLDSFPPADDGPFLASERSFIDAAATLLRLRSEADLVRAEPTSLLPRG